MTFSNLVTQLTLSARRITLIGDVHGSRSAEPLTWSQFITSDRPWAKPGWAETHHVGTYAATISSRTRANQMDYTLLVTFSLAYMSGRREYSWGVTMDQAQRYVEGLGLEDLRDQMTGAIEDAFDYAEALEAAWAKETR